MWQGKHAFVCIALACRNTCCIYDCSKFQCQSTMNVKNALQYNLEKNGTDAGKSQHFSCKVV